jgi:hypothetical protein
VPEPDQVRQDWSGAEFSAPCSAGLGLLVSCRRSPRFQTVLPATAACYPGGRFYLANVGK